MAPLPVKLTAKARKDLRDGLPVTVTVSGQTIRVGPSQISYAIDAYQAGLPVFVLAEVIGGGPMAEITIT